ncbi:glycosyltransferase [Sphingomonas sp.]|uniref:glycosyltransferase n=1 Tax=Sphingomonas sp. TaxID=28214 RepID=UPI000DB3932C|nr:glycosyltransferase [Sphingomonas sp.]PZU06887.1 MAG: glycosyltransferase [Sphingomonas sp.]
MAITSVGIVLHDFALGGTERIAVRLGRAWAEQGVDVRVFCGEDTGPLRSFLGKNIPVLAAEPALPRAQRDRGRLAIAAAEEFARDPVDAVFVPGNYHWPVAHRLTRMARGRRPVVAAQISAAVCKPQRGPVRQRAYDWQMRRLLKKADGLIALSGAARVQVEDIVSGPAVRSIPSPALDDVLPPPTQAEGRMVMAAGRLVPEKGFGMLIEAFARTRDPDAMLTIVGEGPDEGRLRALIGALNLEDRVTLAGYQPDIRPWLDRARLFVLSSDYEGYPAVMIEALAAGRPVIATDCTPATSELLTSPDRGMVVPVGFAASMAAAIDTMLARPAPDAAQLAVAVDRHRLGHVARLYLDFFAELATRRV